MRIVVQWSRFGPYHAARLRAAHDLFERRGGTVVAIETAGTDETYAWRSLESQRSFQHIQLFPNAPYEALVPSVIHRALTAELDRINPDAVAINSYAAPEAHAAIAWCRRHKRAAVCMMESTAADAARSAAREWSKSQIVRQFDAALAGGTPQREYVVQLGVPNDRVFEPYDAVDNDFFATGAADARLDPPRHLPGLEDERPFFLASNRFVPRKNLERLVEAYAAFRAGDAPRWRLVLLGDGRERASLEALVARLGVPDVSFAGFQQIETLPSYYGLAGAFVHPALMEPWGLVVNEALACGLPVLVSDRVGASVDLVIDGETGFRFDPERTEDLAALLRRVADMTPDARQAMGERGRALVDRWSLERFAEGLWDAAKAGQRVADRRLGVTAGALMWAHRAVSRRPDAFHAFVE